MTAFVANSGGDHYFDGYSGGSVNATLNTYNISAGSRLIVRTDSYACSNHSSAFGSLDTVTFSGQGGTLQAQSAIRHIMVGCMAWSLPGWFVVSKAQEDFDDQGQLKDAAQKEQLAKFLGRFLDELKGR